MKEAPKKDSGNVLAITIILLIILAFIATALTRLLLGRYMTAAKVKSSVQGHLLAESVEGMVQACLQNSMLGNSTCAPSAAEQACFPASIAGKTVSVTFAGSPPNCQVQIKVDE